ncbi:hypothetical protein ACFVAR_23355, partial [Bacillus subtilis]
FLYLPQCTFLLRCRFISPQATKVEIHTTLFDQALATQTGNDEYAKISPPATQAAIPGTVISCQRT